MIKLKFLFIFIFIVKIASAQIYCDECTPSFTGFCRTFNAEEHTYVIQEFKNGHPIGIWFIFDTNRNLIKQLNTANKLDSLNQIYPYIFKRNIDVEVPDYDRTIVQQYDPYKDSIERANEILEIVEETAVFVGGTDSLMKFFKNNLRYPEYAREAGLEGRIYVKFVVEKDGTISLPVVMRGIKDCPMCDKEAQRVVKSMPKWTPAKHQGKIVRSYMIVPVKFSLK